MEEDLLSKVGEELCLRTTRISAHWQGASMLEWCDSRSHIKRSTNDVVDFLNKSGIDKKDLCFKKKMNIEEFPLLNCSGIFVHDFLYILFSSEYAFLTLL